MMFECISTPGELALDKYAHGGNRTYDHGGNRTYDLWNTSPMQFFKLARCGYTLRVTSQTYIDDINQLNHKLFLLLNSCDSVAMGNNIPMLGLVMSGWQYQNGKKREGFVTVDFKI